ncbi:uncharacterized protein N7483_007287 [Penicillium malachiteum]|uniref:uncharacterized protein n=1 Tax=Penicillium malachiteum TaxID=1324776 RepID=UPI002547DC88|nr:uncharacterized protein N7483_007287 [Penicillium malachiteum]KAJ5725930.1 hypothetical protein N7483_007287 [Penicillium malachiteum]
MRPHLSLLAICTAGLSASAVAKSSPVEYSTEPGYKNANHIFNTIQDSMRQWGSSLHHNGVSFFLATVPAGTQFYHGTSRSSFINGTEWLAFEPEHAMNFARPHMGRPRHDDDDKKDGEGDKGPTHEELRRKSNTPPVEDAQIDEDAKGYLHTYAAAKHLRLLYIDGMSAGKTQKGTLDSQDVLLFNNTIGNGDRDGSKGPGPMGERERALEACELAENDWAGRIDGVLRMEAGFEVILCDFERDLSLVNIVQVNSESSERGPGPKHDDDGRPPFDDGKRPKGPGGPGGGGPDSSRWARAVAARYTGIGGHRVFLNYDNFISAFTYGLDLFPNDAIHPRLDHLSYADLEPIRRDLTATILTHDPREFSWDWQATTDMVITRYSEELSYFASERMTSLQALRSQIGMLLEPFVDYSGRNAANEVERCAIQFIPLPYQEFPTIPARAVHGVTHSICATLLEAAAESDLTSAQKRIKELMEYLDWTTWKHCRGCQDNEICVIPIWPMGSVEDYAHPQCKDALQPYNSSEENYWGGFQ